MKKINIFKNASIYIIGSFFTQGLTFITLPIFSSLLDPTDYGLYASYNFWISIVGIFLGLQLSSTIGNAYIDYGKENIYRYLSSTIGVGGLSFCILLAITIICNPILSGLFEIQGNVLIIGVVQAFFIFCLNVLVATYRFLEKPIRYIILTISNAVLNISISIALLVFVIREQMYMSRVYSSLIAALFTGGISLLLILKKRERICNCEYWKYGLKISIPLIFHSLAALIFARIDQLIILKMMDASSAGIYSYSNSIGQIISVLYTALNQAFVPWYYVRLKENDIKKIKSISEKYIMAFSIIFMVILLVLPEVIMLVSDEKYFGAVNIVPILFASYFMNYLYTFPVNYEFYLKKTNYIAIGTIISMVVNIILDIILIPQWGSFGAGLATLFSYTALFVLHFCIAKYKIGGYEMNLSCFIKNIFFVGVVVLLYYVLMDKLMLRIGLIMVILVTIILKYKNVIKNIIFRRRL